MRPFFVSIIPLFSTGRDWRLWQGLREAVSRCTLGLRHCRPMFLFLLSSIRFVTLFL